MPEYFTSNYLRWVSYDQVGERQLDLATDHSALRAPCSCARQMALHASMEPLSGLLPQKKVEFSLPKAQPH